MGTPVVPVVPADILQDDTDPVSPPIATPTQQPSPDAPPAQAQLDPPEPTPADIGEFEDALDEAEEMNEEATLSAEEQYRRQNPNRNA